jgi:hypothetical protein
MTATANTPDILWLGDRACHDPAQVGGKAAQLSRLAADYRVPPGFCLTADAFDPALPRRSTTPDPRRDAHVRLRGSVSSR